MLKEPDPIPISRAEEAAGFSVLTLVYPERYELPRLHGQDAVRYERAVALLVDDDNRFRRSEVGTYIHERFDRGSWSTAAIFESLDDLLRSAVHLGWRRST